MGHSNVALLASLKDHPDFECVQASSSVDISSNVKNSYKISYDVPEIAWLTDPPVTKGIKVPLQEAKDTFGL